MFEEKVAIITGGGQGPAARTEHFRQVAAGHDQRGGRDPLFDTDDEGYAILLVDGAVPAELDEKARLAADNCPEFAIEIVED